MLAEPANPGDEYIVLGLEVTKKSPFGDADRTHDVINRRGVISVPTDKT
jgi:hypothetical protein